MDEVTIQIRRLRPEQQPLELPAYMTPGAAGMDLSAAIEADVCLGPLERALIPTGIAIALPDGFEAQIRPRSGLAFRHGLTMLNSPGTIDSDYRGEIQILAINLGREPITIRRGQRIAQMVIQKIARARWHEVAELPPSGRQGGGFGHTDS
ncbi:MAG TPA: dUTP diphosphatase [Candidatus Eisenbacteria bacterium]|nr:dUTP diphosphatase [Candidatus Eisenbacteria bacterium]